MDNTVETPRDQRLSELNAELGIVVDSLVDDAKDAQCGIDNPEYASALVDLGAAAEKMQAALIGELMRSHPEYFTKLPNGNWVPTERAIEH